MSLEKSVLIAMSGGVDSSVAAVLMNDEGYRCEGMMMRLRPAGDDSLWVSDSSGDEKDAEQAASRLGMPFQVIDLSEEFRSTVIDKFIDSYESGLTPNPCIGCNRYIKFGRLLSAALEKGLNFLATGHYARVEQDPASGRWILRKASDLSRDQSYVLYSLTQEQLSHVKFPLGGLSKTEVRRIAESRGLMNAGKRDSQDICFVPDGDYAGFMERFTGRNYPPGDFLDTSGKVIGRHRGAVRYTLGQRRGLGIAAGVPVYVCGKNMADNTVTVGDSSSLYSRSLTACDFNWVSISAPSRPVRMKAKARYRQEEQPVLATPLEDGRVLLTFDEPQRALTPGQAAVLYDGDMVAGGGTIQEVFRD